MKDTLHAVRLLHGELVRLDGRRKRQIEKANADYRADLFIKISGADETVVAMVQQALDLDRQAPELAADLRHALWRKRNGMQQLADQDDHEADTLPPESDDLPPRLPPHRVPIIDEPQLVMGIDLAGGDPGTMAAECQPDGSLRLERDPWDLGPITPRLASP